MADRYDEMKLEPIDGRGMELALESGLGITPTQYAALDGRVQANTDAVGVLDGRVDVAEQAVEELTDGLDARYTKDETDGLLAGKASKSKVPAETGMQTIAEKSQFYPVAQDNTGRRIAIQQDKVWKESDWTSTSGIGLGHQALQLNTGAYSNGLGSYALQGNTGDSSNGFGHSALQNNTGSLSNGVGHQALRYNTGNQSTGVGHLALQSNTGVSSTGVGSFALLNNNGSNNSAFGSNANNTTDPIIQAFSNTTCLGVSTLPNKSNQVVLGNGSVDTVKMGGTARTPASSTDIGVKGETCWDTDYFYICVATNIWKRVKLEVW